ncbi:MAG: DUF262 domain-containing protein [Deltaproteobacteria bacterium]|nr:DUF262 domain-containing protein [Deltaproteobacteria bacterium]
MKGFVSSFSGLFADGAGGRTVRQVCIPLLQRDFAQGRTDGDIPRIRREFVEALHRATTSDESLDLDYVFGDLAAGAFTPLDGQQRLTTLFLLHWYLAAQAGQPLAGAAWTAFTYGARASARAFCEALVAQRPPPSITRLSGWVRDQAWFLATWRHDPTVSAMLVVLDEIHDRFRTADCAAAWRRLIDVERPAITFHVLPIEGIGRPDDLYVKMNSRGKPLTPFESFKARFEQTLEAVDPGRSKAFADKVDGAWSDMLWPMRGDDNVIDDEFMRYLHFVTEVCEWTAPPVGASTGAVFGAAEPGAREARAHAAFGPSNPRASVNIDLLFAALDCWCGEDIPAFFAARLARGRHEPGKVVLFGREGADALDTVDLLAACCRTYGELRGNVRAFSLDRTLLLYAAVVHRTEKTPDFARRLRVLRNLLEASEAAVRTEAMPTLVRSVRRFVVDGDLDAIDGLRKEQVVEERCKAAIVKATPALAPSLDRIEDHPLLRGCLGVMALDPCPDEGLLAARVETFEHLFGDDNLRGALTGALLACGDYSQPYQRGRSRRFGSSSRRNNEPWMALFSGAGRPELRPTRDALRVLLDRVAAGSGPLADRLELIRRDWLAAREAAGEFDWRYYFVKYDAMREGLSGIYVGLEASGGFSACMLDRFRLNSYYRDPFLLAMLRASGVDPSAVRDPWFMGYEHEPRWMHLSRSGTELRCVDRGVEVHPPPREGFADAFAAACATHGVGADGVLAVPQADRAGRRVDLRDRVAVGSAFLRDLVTLAC